MATAKSGGGREEETTGVPEVDRIIKGSKFCKLPTPQVSEFRRGPRFQELAAHHRARNNAATITPQKDNVDHFSRMPSEILKFIISHLTMREAAATSVLSAQWRNLWTTSLSCLNFDIPNMIGHEYRTDIFEEKSQYYITRERSDFTIWVNDVIMQFFCHASRLDALRVSFVLDKDSAPDIDRWIMSSVARGVTEFHLDFHYNKFCGDLHDPDKEYEFPAQLVASTVRYLYLKFCQLNLPPDFIGFTSLVSLTFYEVVVTQSLMEDIILPKCPLLEFLSMKSCYSPDGTSFKFAGTSLRLKHLHIGTTDGVTNIELHNINLLSFELGESSSKLSIRNAPHLSRLVLLVLDPVDIVSNTPRLETLSLVQYYEKTCATPQKYVLNNIKRLVFIAHYYTTNLLGVLHTLEACHSLQKLELDMGIDKSSTAMSKLDEIDKRLTALPGFPLSPKLKEVEIYGFEAYTAKVRFVKYLLKNAAVLQKMTLYTTTKVYHGDGRWAPRIFTSKQATSFEKVCKEKQATLLKDVHKELRDIARSSTNVELFSSPNL